MAVSRRRGSAGAGAALLRFIGGEEAGRNFDGADMSLAGLGGEAAVAGLACWDSSERVPGGGVRMMGLDLSGTSLRQANLSGADLSGAMLGGAVCSGIVLRQARLEQARLPGADLVGGDLTKTDAGQAEFDGCLLEDAVFAGARLRFASLADAVMDGANFDGADLWGAVLTGVAAERASFREARLDEAQMKGADLASADMTKATLRRADLSGTNLRRAMLREAVLEGANLSGADLRGATLPHLDLSSCVLDHVRISGVWLERTRLRASQLGGAIGEERDEDFAAAREGYIALEQNFRSLGSLDDASWAFRRRRRMGKRLHGQRAAAALRARDWGLLWTSGLGWLGDEAAELICDYGESVTRVLWTLLATLVLFCLLYWVTGSLVPRGAEIRGREFGVVDYVLFSLDSMTTVGTGEVGLRPGTQLGVLLSSVETVVGTILLGLLGFVLGARMRR